MASQLLESYGGNFRQEEELHECYRQKPLFHAGCEHFTDPPKYIALLVIDGEEFKAMTQTDAVTHQRPKLEGISSQRQGKFHGNHFASFQFSRHRSADSILAQLIRTSP